MKRSFADCKRIVIGAYRETNGVGQPIPLATIRDELKISPTWLRIILEDGMNVEIDGNGDGVEAVAWVTKI